MELGESEARRADPADPLVGALVGGRYRVGDRIARGGMANVYFAIQTQLNRPVALKVVRVVRDPEGESEEKFRRRFLQEASILSQLQHPNIVMLFDYGQIEDLPGEHYFMAMEYLRGETLAQRFRAQGRLSVEDSIRLARQVGRGLREAHRRGFVHRDLKPSNIMLVPEDDRNDLVKLVDFGIGKIVKARPGQPRDAEEVTRIGLLLGSPRYMSPEQIRSEPVESRTDLYGLGVILFQALTGRLPFQGRTEVEVLIAHCSTPAPTLEEACPDQHFPASLAKLVISMLEKQTSRRPTIDEFLQQLGVIEEELFGSVALAGPTSHSRRTPPPVEKLSLSARNADWDSVTPPTLKGPPGTSVGPVSLVTRPTAAPRRTKRLQRGAWLLLGGLLAGACGVLMALNPNFGLSARKSTRALRAAATSAAASTPAPGALGAQSFELAIESTPTGASVTEGTELIGVTPLSFSVPRESVTSAPRTFVLKREGFAPYELSQADSEVGVHVSAELLPLGPARGSSARSAQWPASGTSTGLAGSRPLMRKASGSLEIRTSR